MSQRAFAVKKLTETGRITNGDFLAQFQHFTGRNRLTDAWMKAYWASRGFEIRHFFGDSWEKNGWELKPILGAVKDHAAEAVALAEAVTTGERNSCGGEWAQHVHPFPAPHISNRHQNQLPL